MSSREGFEHEVVARHYAQAGLADRAAERWQRAGASALAQSAYSEASRCFRSGLDLIPGLPDDVARNRLELELQTGLGVSLMAMAHVVSTAPPVLASMTWADPLSMTPMLTVYCMSPSVPTLVKVAVTVTTLASGF